ncbi:MAG: NAD(P)-binding domain-containing protein [Clostridia bacterium]|nr:NAD(P)-binding domain-containing protein [Clostridia bacterium]
MRPKTKIAVAGGDARLLTAASKLQDDGFEINVFGTEEAGFAPGVPRAGSLDECVRGAAAVLLGTPFSRDGGWINIRGADCAVAFTALCEMMAPRGLILGGMMTADAAETASRYGVRVRDYFDREEVAVLNAVPTAEGAVALAMSILPVTLCGAKTAVVGYGRVGRALVPRLCALGARVTVAARDPAQRAWCRTAGVNAVDLPDIPSLAGSDVIFNTVPARVIGEKELSAIGSSPIIDLASAPGGVDSEAARAAGCRVIQALSLPGKVAPVTAGGIIKEAVAAILAEEGVAP